MRLLRRHQCQDGLVPIDDCNCGSPADESVSYMHERLCGYEPCPRGCWDRLHPPVAVNLPVSEDLDGKLPQRVPLSHRKISGKRAPRPQDAAGASRGASHRAALEAKRRPRQLRCGSVPWRVQQALLRVLGCRLCLRTGMIPLDECTCGAMSPYYAHEPMCGWIPCPRLCPVTVATELDAVAVWRDLEPRWRP